MRGIRGVPYSLDRLATAPCVTGRPPPSFHSCYCNAQTCYCGRAYSRRRELVALAGPAHATSTVRRGYSSQFARYLERRRPGCRADLQLRGAGRKRLLLGTATARIQMAKSRRLNCVQSSPSSADTGDTAPLGQTLMFCVGPLFFCRTSQPCSMDDMVILSPRCSPQRSWWL